MNPICFQNERVKIEPAWFVNGAPIPAGNRVLPHGISFIAKDPTSGNPSDIVTIESGPEGFYARSVGPVGTALIELWGYVSSIDNPRPAPASQLASVVLEVAEPPVLGILVGPSLKA